MPWTRVTFEPFFSNAAAMLLALTSAAGTLT